MHNDDETAVKSAAARLVAAFGRHDRDTYFASFAPDASFVFHNLPRRLDSRDDYLREWLRWEAEDGFHVQGCSSSAQRVQCFGDIAVFTHTVRTEVATKSGRQTLQERETIVFRALGRGVWIAVHEHLSPAG